ncbi:MAG: hypothetical protein HFG55_00725 [Lachnospiraceae bacterium]|nr:hypothetical protein [Lachnospiraceae bacterium]
MKVLTEADLRTAKLSGKEKEYHVSEGTFVTAPAKEYLRDRGIRLIWDKSPYQTMSYQKIAQQSPHPYVDAHTGKVYQKKPEEMTHLQGNLLVEKTDPRIELRGGLDFLQARVVLLQAKYRKNERLREELAEVLRFIRAILGAEVKGDSCGELVLFGLRQEELKEMSHHVREHFGIDHPVPDSSMGEMALELNLLRTQVREVELSAARAFVEGDKLLVIQNLNRLSSGIYVLFCRCLAGYYEKEGGGP